MAKHTAVIFDRASDDITHEQFWSDSTAIHQYDSMVRASAGTVWIWTPRGVRITVVGTMQSVLEDFRKAAEAPGTCAYIVSQDKVANLEAHSGELVEAMIKGPGFRYDPDAHRQELADRARQSIEKLRATSKAWRSELVK